MPISRRFEIMNFKKLLCNGQVYFFSPLGINCTACNGAAEQSAKARILMPSGLSHSLIACGNLLAATDKDDYFLIKLLPIPVEEVPAQYWFELAPTNWTSTSLYIRLQLDDWQRNPLASWGKTIYAPSPARCLSKR